MLLINSTNHGDIIAALHEAEVTAFHATNGTYVYAAEMIVPTTLAGFQFLAEERSQDSDAFVIAVNSDLSMTGIMDAKKASQEERDALEDQEKRAMKVAIALQKNHPDRQVIVMFYDEDTPTALYDAIAESGTITMESLHKWGYGTDPNAPKIEGAHNFRAVYGFPLSNDTKPLCHDLTAHEDQSSFVEVVKLNKYLDRVEHGRVLPAPTNTL
ncbi:MAG: hypothetical protein CMH31_02480 [Micavibrio sp.]|nr:hypothetical protein [Micavibrio sp.]|tara:strand:- start:361 stop:999 length:639 start_codon:yes stop_codon:yes gene_type:complete